MAYVALTLSREDLHGAFKNIPLEEIEYRHFASSIHQLWREAHFVVFKDSQDRKDWKILKDRNT